MEDRSASILVIQLHPLESSVQYVYCSCRAVRLPFLLDFSFLHHSCRRVSTVFYVTAMIRNINVLAARLMETLLSRQIVLPMRKKMVKENSLGANYFKQLSTRKYKKKSCHGHFKVNFIKFICLVESFTQFISFIWYFLVPPSHQLASLENTSSYSSSECLPC